MEHQVPDTVLRLAGQHDQPGTMRASCQASQSFDQLCFANPFAGGDAGAAVQLHEVPQNQTNEESKNAREKFGEGPLPALRGLWGGIIDA